jgi:hypothetical protein
MAHDRLFTLGLLKQALQALHPSAQVQTQALKQALSLLHQLDDPKQQMLSLLRSVKFKYKPARHGDDLSAWVLSIVTERYSRQEAHKKAEARSRMLGGGCYICREAEPIMRDEFGGLICAECRARYLRMLKAHQQEQFRDAPPRSDVSH